MKAMRTSCPYSVRGTYEPCAGTARFACVLPGFTSDGIGTAGVFCCARIFVLDARRAPTQVRTTSFFIGFNLEN